MLVKESSTGRLQRYYLIALMYAFMIMSAVLIAAQAILFSFTQFGLFDIIGVLFCIPFFAVGWYFRNRIAKLDSLEADSFGLSARGKSIILKKKDLISIRKLARFAASETAWFIICFLNAEGKKERWLFKGQADIGLIDCLKKMGNMPVNMP